MKTKLWMLGAAVAALTSCTQSEVVEIPESRVIGFDSHVDKGTRAVTPIASKNALSKFAVYGHDGSNMIFNKTEVVKDAGTNMYEYSGTQQTWHVGTTYKFAAFSDGNENSATTSFDPTTQALTISNYEVDDTKDLIASILPPVEIDETGSNIPAGRLMFSFKHLLSRVRFEIENSTSSESNLGIKIDKITINGIKTGNCTYALNNDNSLNCTWAEVTKGDYVYDFGDAVIDPGKGNLVEHFVIPQSNDIDITITVSSYVKNGDTYSESPTSVKNHIVSLNHGFSGTDGDDCWKEGWVYNYLIKVGATASYIKFDASVSDWDYDFNGNNDQGSDDDITSELN